MKKDVKQKNESFVFKYYQNQIFSLLSLLFLFVSLKSMNKLELFVSKLIHFEIQALFALIFCLGLEKNASFRFDFMNKIFFSSLNVSILLSISTFTLLNVFVSLRYRISSISKLYYRTFLFQQVGCNRNAGQEGRRTRGIQDRRDVYCIGQEGYRTRGMQDTSKAGKMGCKEMRDSGK